MPVTTLYVVIFIASALVLARSATFLVESLKNISLKLKIPEFTVAFILMALATSLPELFVGITSALEKTPTLSLGNVVGSNIANITIIFGLAALISQGIRIEKTVRNRDVFDMSMIAIIPMLLLLDGVLSRVDGAILMVVFLIYMYDLLVRKGAYTKVLEKEKRRQRPLVLEITAFLLGLSVLLISAELLVKSATVLAQSFNIPPIIIGIFIIGLGTSLPELSFELFSLKKRQSELALGNIMGSVVTNSTLVLGTTALITPIEVEYMQIFFTSFAALFAALVLFLIFIRTGYRITTKEALILVFFYIAFLIFELFLKA